MAKCQYFISPKPKANINYLAFDSRNVFDFKATIFIAIKQKHRDGHNYVKQLYDKGCINFIVESGFDTSGFLNANFLIAENSLLALQQIALFHRNRFSLPVIGITGSNGKTIIKEWLSQMLEEDYVLVKTPQSFNSQIGVPISIWNICPQHQLGIFEAGISMPQEMSMLEKIIQPSIGIFSNIGHVHQENFATIEEKIKEKLLLFKNAKVLIYTSDGIDIKPILQSTCSNLELFSIGGLKDDTISVKQIVDIKNTSKITLQFDGKKMEFEVPFSDKASLQNCLISIGVLLYLKYDKFAIQEKIKWLSALPMRLAVMQGVNNCLLINDTYSNDQSALQLALQYMQQRNAEKPHSLILSDMVGIKNYEEIANIINQIPLSKFIGIGKKLFEVQHLFNKSNIKECAFFKSAEAFKNEIKDLNFNNELILFKGARSFQFEKLLQSFKKNIHETTLEINLSHLQENFKTVQSILSPSTKIMAVVKAFAYGSGSVEVARVLEKNNVHYLAVAYINEGIQLREAGIITPIMVMNCNEKVFDFLIQYQLEPEIFSFELLHNFVYYLSLKNIYQYPIHIKLDTGMNRLGFKKNDKQGLLKTLKSHLQYLKIKSVFSHLVASEDIKQDKASHKQCQSLLNLAQDIEALVGYSFLKHIANSGAILRQPQLHLDMVRLGIALYGISPFAETTFTLKNVLTLKTSIAQIKEVEIGETIGYNAKVKVQKKIKIAIIRIGYAEGYQRSNGNGNGKVLINNTLAQSIGNVCMDMTMIDITHIQYVEVGDPVIIFGEALDVNNVAKLNNTIAYEIITNISPRVRREYIY